MLSYIQKHLRLMKKTTVNWKEVLPMKKDYKSVNINVPYQPVKKVKKSPCIQPHSTMQELVDHRLNLHDA